MSTAELLSAVLIVAASGAVSFLVSWFETHRQTKAIALQAEEQRQTARHQYQLEAEKSLRTAVGGPKGQLIEAVHDLADRLRRILTEEGPRAWTA